MKKLFTATAVLAFSILSSAALATPLTMSGGIANGILAQGSYTGTFKSSGLPADYAVNSLSFTFNFIDDTDTFSTSAPTVTSQSSTGYAKYFSFGVNAYLNTNTVHQTVEKNGQQESASLSFGNYLAGSGATSLSTSTSMPVSSSSDTIRDGCDGFLCSNWYYTKTEYLTTTVTNDWQGAFSVAGTITDQALIGQILKNGQLAYSLAVSGDLKLLSSSVQLDYTARAPGGEVPEPSSLLLAGAGLAALGYGRRRAARR